MKIGILTIYNAYNFGCYLQVYAMQNTLTQMGHEVDVLDCSNKNLFQRLKHRYPPARSLAKTVYKQKLARTYRKAWKKLNIKRFAPENGYDVLIVGSDEVWNLNGKFEHWKEYLGMGCGTARIIGYAPSIGYCSPDELKNNTEFVSGVRNFERIFARDKVTLDLCTDITGKKTERVVDPTILFKDSWKSHMMPLNVQGDYLVYYSYLDNTPMKEFIKKFARERNLKIVVAGFCYKWGDEILHPSPLEFLTLINNAKYVITSTFHGSLFAILLHRKLIVRPSGQKVTDLLSMVNLEDRIFKDDFNYVQFAEMLDSDIDYDGVDKKLNEQRLNSLRMLQDALDS